MREHRLDVRPTGSGCSFYIDGSLQFDTADEHIYHEFLVLPALALAAGRTAAGIDALVMGGGDGLAARELLRHPRLRKVDLVDHDERVVGLARGAFAAFNKGSLADPRVAVTVADAAAFLRERRKKYGLIIADFTFPDTLAGCDLFTLEFFSLVKERLARRGLFAMNAVSPSASTAAYWSICRTLHELRLHPKPLGVEIPSFSSQGYGEWGFFISSQAPILAKELRAAEIPAGARHLTRERLFRSLRFPRTATKAGFALSAVLKEPADLLCLLNLGGFAAPSAPQDADEIDFLVATAAAMIRGRRPLTPAVFSSELITAWESRILGVLRSLDWELLLREADLLNLRRSWQAISVLMILIICINIVYPDNAFAKGYYGSHYHGSGDSSVTLLLIAPETPSPFHGDAFNSTTVAGFVPDMRGKRHARRKARGENLFYAVSDDLFLTRAGEVYFSPGAIPFLLKMEPDRALLIEDGAAEPVFAFYPDGGAVQALKKNVQLQQKAADEAEDAHARWLIWAGPARKISKELDGETVEMKNIAAIRAALAGAAKDLPFYKTSSRVPYQAWKLVPGVYLTAAGAIVFERSDGAFVCYPYKSFAVLTGTPRQAPSEALDRFVAGVLKQALAQNTDRSLQSAILRGMVEK